jgi:membrane associated rhomboid family serine protease
LLILLAWMLDNLLSLVLLLPIKDDRGRLKSFPYMTVGLIVLNVLAFIIVYFLLPLWIGDEAVWSALERQLLLTPVDVLAGEGWGAITLVTSAFLHADWGHLLSNMFFLYFFGRKVEDMLGSAKFGLFYLVCVFVSGAFSVAGEAALPLTQGKIPGLGASGAVMGLVGAYLFLYPDQRIHTLPMLGILPIPIPIHMPAWAFILYTVIHDALRGWLEEQFQALGYVYSFVGSLAHLGGVIAGLTCLFFFLPGEMLYYRRQLGSKK